MEPSSRLPLNEWERLTASFLWFRGGAVKEIHRYCSFNADIQTAWMLTQGSLELQWVGGLKESFNSGQWVFPAKGHGMQLFSADAAVLSLRFVLEWPEGTPLFERNQTRSFPSERYPKLEALTHQAIHAPYMQSVPYGSPQQRAPTTITDFFAHNRIVSSWMESLVEAMMNEQVPVNLSTLLDTRVDTAIRIIRQTPWTTRLSEKSLATSIGVSVSQLNKLFVSHTGRTPAAWREERRFIEVSRSLASETHSIKETAFAHGFRSLAHFSTWFRNRANMSPREYVASHFRRLIE